MLAFTISFIRSCAVEAVYPWGEECEDTEERERLLLLHWNVWMWGRSQEGLDRDMSRFQTQILTQMSGFKDYFWTFIQR